MAPARRRVARTSPHRGTSAGGSRRFPTGLAPTVPSLLLTGVLLAVVPGCGEEAQVEVAGPELLNLGASQVMVEVETYVFGKLGTRQARVLADTAYFLEEEEGAVNLRRVHVTFFNDAGGFTSTLTARQGRYHFQTGNMQAQGRVVVIDVTSTRRLETPSLDYVAEDDELIGDTSFVFHRGEEVVRGESFRSDPSLENIRIKGPSGVSPATGGGN